MMNHPFNPRRREPRQPAVKGHIVHTTETPERTNLAHRVDAALERETEASVALDGETRSVETPTKEETTVRTKAPTKLPVGEQGSTVAKYIRKFPVGAGFNPQTLWNSFAMYDKDRWLGAYGSEKEAIARVRHSITNVRHTGKVSIDPIKGKVSHYLVSGKGQGPSKAMKDKAAERPIVIGEGYTLIGTHLNGQGLYVDKDGVVGIFNFQPILPR